MEKSSITNLVGIWKIPKTEFKTQISFKNGFYYAKHLDIKETKLKKYNRHIIEQYIKFYNMEKVN